jgi:hypothetical protein
MEEFCHHEPGNMLPEAHQTIAGEQSDAPQGVLLRQAAQLCLVCLLGAFRMALPPFPQTLAAVRSTMCPPGTRSLRLLFTPHHASSGKRAPPFV